MSEERLYAVRMLWARDPKGFAEYQEQAKPILARHGVHIERWLRTEAMPGDGLEKPDEIVVTWFKDAAWCVANGLGSGRPAISELVSRSRARRPDRRGPCLGASGRVHKAAGWIRNGESDQSAAPTASGSTPPPDRRPAPPRTGRR